MRANVTAFKAEIQQIQSCNLLYAPGMYTEGHGRMWTVRVGNVSFKIKYTQ